MIAERMQGPRVRGHRVVCEEARNHRLQPPALLGNGIVHAATQLRLDLLKRRPHAVAPCLAVEQERSTPGLAADERESKKSESLRSTCATPLSAFGRVTTELQQARLLPVQFESKLFEPRSHRIPEAPRIGLTLEAGHDIVGIPHEDHLSGGLAPPPLLSPEIEDVVQVDVGKQR